MSSSNTAVSARGLSKAYAITGEGAKHVTLAESALAWLKNPLRRPKVETFWALRDVSFEIKRGDVVGVIGRNGAGKSTLLKVLSRITEPSAGEVDLYGRVGSLLEVGTGFHPELSGREHIYLNGAILGMTRFEIRRQFDAIVQFAGVERFLDTPVKRYSSGMYVRLAFAVAAHLNSEILIVDEVLAVGDAEFQQKCLGKMREVGDQGRTVILVSHTLPVITRLCNRVILFKNGRIEADGTSAETVRAYLSSGTEHPAERLWHSDAAGDEVCRLRAVRIRDAKKLVNASINIEETCFIEIEYDCEPTDLRPSAVFHLINEAGNVVFSSADFNNKTWYSQARRAGHVLASCQIPANFLAEGRFSVLAAVVSVNPICVHALERDAISFQVVDRSDGCGVRGPYVGAWPGEVRPMLEWDVVHEAFDEKSLPIASNTLPGQPKHLDRLIDLSEQRDG
jgi:lipopolysaccharide transport system ATP-binding protein